MRGPLAKELEGASALINRPRHSTSPSQRRPLVRGARAGALRARRPAARDPRSLRDRAGRGGRSALDLHQRQRHRLLRRSRQRSRSAKCASPGDDFLADLCVEWEAEASACAEAPAGRRLVRGPADRPGAREVGRGAAADDAAVPLLRRRPRSGPGAEKPHRRGCIRLDWIEMVRWLVDTPARRMAR